MQGTARRDSGLCASTGVVDQGSVAVAVGSDGGDGFGSGLLQTRRHHKVRARTGASRCGAQGVVESRAQERWGQGTALKWLTARALSREPGLGCWSGSRQGLRGM